MKSNISERKGVVTIPAESAYFEQSALNQLEQCSALPGSCYAVGFPDLHPGKGIPVGATLVTQGRIYPSLIGGDIGCGMSFWQTDYKLRKFKADVVVRRFAAFEQTELHLLDAGLPFAASLGSVGGGNHFVELQRIERVYDQSRANELGLCERKLQLLLHSGSRGYGEQILRAHVDVHAARGLDAESTVASAYMQQHDAAVDWAALNRKRLAQRVGELMGTSVALVSDVPHNLIESKEVDGEPLWLHRKGAAVADRGPLVIAGSRGTFSYLVEPLLDCADAAWSLSHGAGRKWNRTESLARMRQRFRKEQLVQTALGGRVICTQKQLLFEEAPPVYKDIDVVVQHLVAAGLIRVIASLRPLLTYKTSTERRSK